MNKMLLRKGKLSRAMNKILNKFHLLTAQATHLCSQGLSTGMDTLAGSVSSSLSSPSSDIWLSLYVPHYSYYTAWAIALNIDL